jgi:hypothetical protein
VVDERAIFSEWFRARMSEAEARAVCAGQQNGHFVIRGDEHNAAVLHLYYQYVSLRNTPIFIIFQYMTCEAHVLATDTSQMCALGMRVPTTFS